MTEQEISQKKFVVNDTITKKHTYMHSKGITNLEVKLLILLSPMLVEGTQGIAPFSILALQPKTSANKYPSVD